MKHRVVYSPESRRDLEAIWEYIRYSLRNPSAAAHTVDKIVDEIDRLEILPDMGTPLSSIAEVESNERFLVTGNYLSFYRVCGDTVFIDRILNGRCDYLRILLSSPPE